MGEEATHRTLGSDSTVPVRGKCARAEEPALPSATVHFTPLCARVLRRAV